MFAELTVSQPNQRVRGLSARAIKDIAVLAMLFDHFVAVFWGGEPLLGLLLRIPGRIAAPVMCYFIAEGFYHTRSLRRYAGRLLAFAALSHFPYVVYFELSWQHATGVMWPLFLGLLALACAESRRPLPLRVLGVLGCCVLAYPGDWSHTAVLWVVVFGVFRGQWRRQVLGFAAVTALTFLLPSLWLQGPGQLVQLGVFLALPLLAAYNGRRGRGGKLAKWGFYAFYPLHLTVLELLRLALGV